MENVNPMQIRLLWYVLAGFVLGFITSTLWEWLYYRRLRRRTVVRDSSTVTTAWAMPTEGNDGLAVQVEPWATPAYRSSSVLLESEQDLVEPYPLQTTPVASSPFSQAQVAPSAGNRFQAGSTQSAEHLAKDATIAVITPASTPMTMPADAFNGLDEHKDAQSTPAQPVQATSPPVMPSVAPIARQPTAGEHAAGSRLPRANGYPDDLTHIQGIGEAYKRRLYAAGIYTWQQVADSDAELLRNATKAKPNARPQDWKTRAQELAIQCNRWDAVYDGPLPDDLTRINGIGPTYADVLYKAGICTFEQLAGTLPAELAEILPTPAIGNEFNFDSWIEQAVRLATFKQRNESRFR
ncbi:MAG: DUF4332 domain-containing protein [Chloroflexota bacterium]|nr:DUF4332 domain-containing protein [Chloroflexota bacterium]